MNKKVMLLPSAIAVLLAPLLFGWGFAAHRERVFPYSVLKLAADRVGLTEGTERTRTRQQIRPVTAELKSLASLPYLQLTPDPNYEQSGVLLFEKERASPGLNFWSSFSPSKTAQLIDMNGDVVREWSYPASARQWHHAELLPDGSVLVVLKDQGLLKLDESSELIWSADTRPHHDLWIDDEGDIYLLTRWPVSIPELHPTNKILDERITILTRDGVAKDEISLLSIFRNSPYATLLPNVSHLEFDPGVALDLIHTNHVEVFDGSQESRSPLFKRGNILVSARHLNAIAIVDGQTREIVWLWGPNNVALQHEPTLLENGNILLFDNGTEKSRVLELNPVTGLIDWSYAPDEGFYSYWGGSVQRLPNGNTLITETATGYVREVTPQGEIVWRFANPATTEDGERWNLWRMKRFQAEDLPFLDKTAPGVGE